MAWKRDKGRQPFELPTCLAHLPKKINLLKGGDVLLKGTVEVTDLFRGAYLLASGGSLASVRVRTGGRRIATFLITGNDLDRLDSDYRCGRALVNPVQLRESLNHLRDVMFSKLRERDPATPKSYAGPRGSARNDRQREDRGHQARR